MYHENSIFANCQLGFPADNANLFINEKAPGRF